APNFISAIPAASASLSMLSVSPVALVNNARASRPTHAWSRLAAVYVTPPMTTPGKATPVGPAQPTPATSPAPASAIASGSAGGGVATLTRGVVRVPVVTSTVAALIPEPPMSIPSTSTGHSVLSGPSRYATAAVIYPLRGSRAGPGTRRAAGLIVKPVRRASRPA